MTKLDEVGLFKGKYKSWMETYGGRRVNPWDIKEEDVDIDEIAHALSNICRYGGHCRKFYSVAEHSLRVASLLPDNLKLSGLLHDTAEVYLGDVIRPIKQKMPAIVETEDKILELVMKKYGADWSEKTRKKVKEADNTVGATEARDLMYHPEAWGNLPEPLPWEIIPLSSGTAKIFFLMRFEKYGGYYAREF